MEIKPKTEPAGEPRVTDGSSLSAASSPASELEFEATVVAILEQTAHKTGTAFLQVLVRELCNALGARYVMVSELIGAQRCSARVLSMWPPPSSSEPIEYALSGTPCEHVVDKKLCRYDSDVQTHFPEDKMLAEMDVQSYIGALFFTAEGEPTGLLAVLDDQPMLIDSRRENLVRFLALRVGCEIERMRDEDHLRLDRRILENISEGVMITDPDNNIIRVNGAFTEVTGYSAEEALGRRPSMLKSGWHGDDFYREMWRSLKEKGHWSGEIWNRRKSGDIYPSWLSLSLMTEEGRPAQHIAVFSDISLRKSSEARLAYLAHHDLLTGLANRMLLDERFAQSLSLAQREGRMVALMFLDLDRFKTVNDTLGHDVGDQLLMLVSTRLKGSVRDGDTVARLGGDEFILLFHNIGGEEDAVQIAKKISCTMSEPFNLDGNEIFVTVSIGISLYPNDATDRQSLLKYADIAMYRAKDQGRNNYQFYRAEFNARTLERLTMENRLRRALERDELILHYQPVVDMETGRILSAEALIRWQSPDYGFVSPGAFIPLAEETGLIAPIGEWVLNRACAQVVQWRSQGFRTVPIAVNMSARQFLQRGLEKIVEEALSTAGLEGGALHLEITERMMMDNVEANIETMHLLKGLGVKLAVDDFGTGYSSLSYLKRFPLDILKIDQSFVRDIYTDSSDRAIVSIIINMAQALGMGVIAEGVETSEQLELLRVYGCDVCQGFYFSKPVPADEFSQLLVTTNQPDLI